MDRTEKEQLVADLHSNFQDASLIVVTHYSGLTVAEMTALRGKMREVGASFKVSKNRLSKLALKDTSYEGLSDLFSGPVAVAYSADSVAAAKAAFEFAKENDKLTIQGGALGDQVLSIEEVTALAKLPSLDELRAKLIGMVSTPATRIATITAAPATQLARVLKAKAEA